MTMKTSDCIEWTMMPNHALRNRRDGQAQRKMPPTIDEKIDHGWCRW
jgi:hypothetical protein